MVAVIFPENSRNGVFQDIGIPETSGAPYIGAGTGGRNGTLIVVSHFRYLSLLITCDYTIF